MSVIPASLANAGYLTFDALMKKRNLLLGLEGETDTGKTEFILSCPGPGGVLCIDRNYLMTVQNPNPPKARRPDFGFKVINPPLVGTAVQDTYLQYWVMIRDTYYALLADPNTKTCALDGDSDTYEVQRLAAFGKLQGVMSIFYADVNAARRAFVARAHDSGKVAIFTCKLRDDYVNMKDGNGNNILDSNGKPMKEKSGKRVKQGFDDDDYLWHFRLLHLFKPAYVSRSGKDIPAQWGFRITKSKLNRSLEGTELWGEDCNFPGLVSYAFPHIPLGEWGL